MVVLREGNSDPKIQNNDDKLGKIGNDGLQLVDTKNDEYEKRRGLTCSPIAVA